MRSPMFILSTTILLVTSTGIIAEEQTRLGEITVTGTRERALKAETPATVDVIDEKEIEQVRPAHPSEIVNRIPGVYVNVTGGEGHMTAIRQPISTSPVYLYLEDGIPTRSTGFFNHNALYEVNVPQAGGIEINKGPGTALYGSDAIGGVINILTRPAPMQAETEVNVEAGGHGWARLLLSSGNTWGEDGLRADLNITHTDGWREATNYDRQSGTLRWDKVLAGGASLKTLLAISNIDQQTAGSSRLLSDDYYNNPTLNYTPISYREVQALRLSSAYEKETASTLFSITPYYRHNSMGYMPNWSFTYDPSIKDTESDSFGLLSRYRIDFAPFNTRLIVGADLDYTPGNRLEHNINAFKTGRIYTSYTPGEKIYDYDVTFLAISPYMHIETSPAKNLRLQAGLRYDHMSYDYSDNMAAAPTSYSVNFNGSIRTRTYNRPADSRVNFSRLSPKLGATYLFNNSLNGFVSYRRAFRVPSEGQLFRPGSNSRSLNLAAVKVDSYEVGVRGEVSKNTDYEISIYYMSKTDDIVTYQDPADSSNRYTVNAGETLHKGIEIGLNSRLSKQLKLGVSYSRVRHTYKDWVQSGHDFSGNEMKSAPRDMMNTRLNWKAPMLNGGRLELEWVRLGSYWMDDNNTYKYNGHDLLNLRGNYNVDKNFEIYARLMNLADKRYATSASYSAAGAWSPEKFEYAPGLPRTLYAGVNYRFN